MMTTHYAVQRGDTINQLAQRHGLSPDALMRANGMDPRLADGRVSASRADPDRLMPGQRLTIPAATPGYEDSHRVQAGDTLSGIADRWGVSLTDLLRANPAFDPARADGRVEARRGAVGHWDPDALRVGDRIQRPAAVGPAPPPAAGGMGHAPLAVYRTTGASARTAAQDGLAGGVSASRQMARTDEARVLSHADVLQAAADRHGLPPALLAGIASRESRGGSALDARGYGDHGHGFGLMQVDDRNPGLRVATAGGPFGSAHIDQAAGILRGKLDAVRQQYPNASAEDQLRLAVSRYNGGRGVIGDFDRGTTGGDYSADVLARAQYYAERWPGAAAHPTRQPHTAGAAGLPDTRLLSESARYDLYAQRVRAAGDAGARADLAAGRPVILGLRVDTRVDAQGGRGVYDDRIAVLWRGPDGRAHVREFAANTEPSSQYEARGYGLDLNRDGRRELGRLVEGTIRYVPGHSSRLGAVLRPQGNPVVQRDTNHDQRIGGSDGRSASGADFLFHAGGNASTGSAGCQTMAPRDWAAFWGLVRQVPSVAYVLTQAAP